MWKNIGNVVGSAIQKVKTLQSELENQLDEAVGNKNETKVIHSNNDLNDSHMNTRIQDERYVQSLEFDDGTLRNQHNIDPHIPLASSTDKSIYLKPCDSNHNAASNNDMQLKSNSITKHDEVVITVEHSSPANNDSEPSTSEPTVYLPSEEPLTGSKPKRKKKLASTVTKTSDDSVVVEAVNSNTQSSDTVVTNTPSSTTGSCDDSYNDSNLVITDKSTNRIVTNITKHTSNSFFDDDYTVEKVISSEKVVVPPLLRESGSKRDVINNCPSENIDNAVKNNTCSSSNSSVAPVNTMDESSSSKNAKKVVDVEASISIDLHEEQVPVQVVNNDIRASSPTAVKENELIDQQQQSQPVPSSSTITTETATISADDDDRNINNNNNEAINYIMPTTVTTTTDNNDKHDNDTNNKSEQAVAIIKAEEDANVSNNSDNINSNTNNNEALTTVYDTQTTVTVCNDNDDNDHHNSSASITTTNTNSTTTNTNTNNSNPTNSTTTTGSAVAAEATIQKLQEVIADRERALETAMTKMYEINQLLIESESVVMSLKSDITVKNNRIDSLQAENTNYINTIQNNTETTSASVVVINELKNKIKKLNEVIQEKDEKLGLFEQEGQLLSKKQGDYEKTIKQLKKDMKEKMSENMKLKESKDQLVKAIEEMQEIIRKKETDYNTMNKSISAMSAVNQNSNEKFQKLENEILIKGEEIVSQKKALETAWFENNELKRTLVEIKTERDDYKRLLNEGASKVVETESSRRDVEQREAILKATSKQLQDSLQRQMNEYTIREDRLRDELNEMRKRWQEAILSRENLTTELSSSTTPLLRQISQLQESLQQKTTAWQNIESCLSERAYLAEKKKLEYEVQLDQYKDQIKNTMTKMNEYKDKCHEYDHQLASLKSVNQDLTHQLQENQSQLYIEMAQKQQYQSQIQEIEMAKQMEIQELKIYYDDCIRKINITLEGLENEKNQLLQQLQQQKQQQYLIQENGNSCNSNTTSTTTTKRLQHHNNDNNDDDSSKLSLSNNNNRTNNATNDDGDDDDDDESKAGNASKKTFVKSSYANSERVLQQKRKKDQDHRNLYLKIQQIEASRDALLEEVSYLSSKNAEYEDKLSHWGELNQQIQTVQKQKDMLLVLLGEKDEELQASVADNMEVKSLYQHHIQELVLQLTPSSSS